MLVVTTLRYYRFRVLAAVGLVLLLGCAESRSHEAGSQWVFYPPEPTPTRIVAMGPISGKIVEEAERHSALREFVTGENTGEIETGLIRPLSVTVRGHELIVCDVGRSAVIRIDPLTGKISSLMRDGQKPTKPVAVTADANGNVYVSDLAGGSVLQIDQSGSIQNQYRPAGSATDFKPIAAAVSNDKLYVVSRASRRVELFDLASAKHLGQLGAGEQDENLPVFPVDIAVDAAGRIYVVDLIACQVKVYQPDGRLIRQIGEAGNRPGQFARPRSVAVGPDGVIYVSDAASQVVQMFDADGQLLMVFGGPGNDLGSMTLPAGLCIDQSLTPLLAKRLPKGYVSDYLVFVADQLGPGRIGVYAFGRFGGK
jgi:sugar lactone lactonase YvrE